MRIAILTYDFPPSIGGVQTILYEIGRRLARHHEVMVLAPQLANRPEELRYEAPYRRDAHSYWRTLRRLQPDRIIVGHAHSQLLLAAAFTRSTYAALAFGNDFLAGQRRWHRPLFNALLGRANPLVTITEANAERLVALGLPRPVVIYPGTDPQVFRPASSPAAWPSLITVGRLVSRKGIDTVFAALPDLLPQFPELTYVVVGDGPDRERLENLSRSLGVSDAVNFAGQVTVEVLADDYRHADIFVMPAREEVAQASIEGFGIVYLEAAASGLPVVAGRSGGAVEAVRDGVTGFLVPPDDPVALAATLRRLLGDAGLRQRMGAAGRQWVETEMNWDRAAREFAAALDLSD